MGNLTTLANEIEQCMCNASDISLEMELTIKMIRDHIETTGDTDFEKISLLTKLLDMLQKDASNLSNRLFALHENLNQEAA